LYKWGSGLGVERVESMGKGAESDGIESEPSKVIHDIDTLIAEAVPLRNKLDHSRLVMRDCRPLLPAEMRYLSYQEACF